MEKTQEQQTLVLLKPDAVKRGITGRIITRFENTGLTISAMKMLVPTEELSKNHYSEHKDKDFFRALVDFLSSGPVIAIAVSGCKAVEKVRRIIGSTQPSEAAPGTIRGDFSHICYERGKERLGTIPNIVHASDNPENAVKEIKLWFKPEEIISGNYRSDNLFF
jgi:nucleoside-diphosphate kinase